MDLNQASYKTLKEVIAKKTGIAEKYQDLKMFDGHWNARNDLKYYIDNVNSTALKEVLEQVNENRDKILNPPCLDHYA